MKHSFGLEMETLALTLEHPDYAKEDHERP